MSIKYYHLAKDEELPEEFCAIKDVSGEPSEYVFYAPESENAKLRELVRDMFEDMANMDCELRLRGRTFMVVTRYERRMRELGVDE